MRILANNRTMTFARSLKTAIAATVILLAAGCETYSPLPLEPQPKLAGDLHALRNETKPPIDLGKPLSIETIALLAVQNNPDLAAARAGRAIAQAQVLQAGLLPNPQITGNYGFLRAGPGTSDQWTAGLGEDIRALVTFSANRRAAELSAGQTEADLLWQEWQVIGKARLLTIGYVKQSELLGLLQRARDILADSYARGAKAIREGNLTQSSVAPDLAAMADLDKQLADTRMKVQGNARDLDLLLGLDPTVKLTVDPALEIPKIDPAAVEAAIQNLPARRPDLVALKLGYDAQDEKYFAAILGQFPALVLGASGGHDTSKIYEFGPDVTMDLPIFNHNQGNVAIEKATRAKLHDEYTSRLSTDVAEIHGILADQVLLNRQLASARQSAREAEAASAAAERAYAASLIEVRAHADLIGAAAARSQEVITLEQAVLEQYSALVTLTGLGMPKAILAETADKEAMQ
jgi:outer membrane protein TolC